ARFSAPMELGKLPTADPLDPTVQNWWKTKVSEIYAKIPDFGGFVVKANSEGQPGPQNYKRTHAEGASMLADAVAPHGGIIMWRAFVYSNETPRDRALQAYDEFVPLDGKFRDNVIVQVKNGPVDFQPREPYHPLFGAMKKTPTMMEVQITKEYLGFATHLAYLGTMWEEVLRVDTNVAGKGSTVGKIIEGGVIPYHMTAMCGVSNIGSDRNWCGSDFDQANWYAFGRLAWDTSLDAKKIASEWTRMTFGNDPRVVRTSVDMMMRSREAVVDYMTPLGLAHLMDTGHHYGPGPWVNNLGRNDWNPTYYHRADSKGIGFDRTSKGSDAVGQYSSPWRETWNNVATTPDNLLLWFHHLPWTHKMRSGRTLWDEMVVRYSHGVEEVVAMRKQWASLSGKVDPGRFAQVSEYLAIQEKEARWWRDACLAYFQSLNGLPYPAGYAAPKHSLEYYRSISNPYAPGNGA
ncbi:MAG TPA: alpha-glucuronidase, partial [Fimbriimonas sp.]|nr:alpha-glucuronidase [Fimbriimonas sp.]